MVPGRFGSEALYSPFVNLSATEVLGIVTVERPVVTTVKVDEEGHDFAQGQFRAAGAGALPRLEQVPVIERFKPLAEVIDIAAHSNEPAHGVPLVLWC
jgi:hypothetical protein